MGEPGEVVHKMMHEGEGFVGVATRDVGGDVAVGLEPERMAVGERLGVGDVQPGGGNLPGTEGIREGGLVHGGSPADIVEDRSGFGGGEPGGVEIASRFDTVRKDVDDVIGGTQGSVQRIGADHGDGFIPAWMPTERDDLHAKGA